MYRALHEARQAVSAADAQYRQQVGAVAPDTPDGSAGTRGGGTFAQPQNQEAQPALLAAQTTREALRQAKEALARQDANFRSQHEVLSVPELVAILGRLRARSASLLLNPDAPAVGEYPQLATQSGQSICGSESQECANY